jgi:hypothetical protein
MLFRNSSAIRFGGDEMVIIHQLMLLCTNTSACHRYPDRRIDPIQFLGASLADTIVLQVIPRRSERCQEIIHLRRARGKCAARESILQMTTPQRVSLRSFRSGASLCGHWLSAELKGKFADEIHVAGLFYLRRTRAAGRAVSRLPLLHSRGCLYSAEEHTSSLIFRSGLHHTVVRC